MSHSKSSESREKVEDDNSEDEEKIDFGRFNRIKDKFKEFTKSKKRNEHIITATLILFLLILTLYVRVLPLKLEVTNSWARSSVYNYIKNNMESKINQQYPNLPDEQKKQMVNNNFNQLLQDKKQRADIENQIKFTSDYFKQQFQYTDNNKTYTFLGDIDSYYWLRFSRNLVEEGHYCDETVNGTCYDNHMLAPLGVKTKENIHPYMIFYTYKIMKVFNKSIDLMQASYYVPVILSLLITIIAFLIGYKIAGNVGGFFSSLILAVNPFFIRRTAGSDNDIYNILFSLLIIWAVLYAFEGKSKKSRITYSVLAGFFVGLFTFAWSGWWFIYDIVLGSMVLYLLYLIAMKLIKKKGKKVPFKELFKINTMKNALIIILLFFLSAGLFVSLFSSFHSFIGGHLSPIRMKSLKTVVHGNLWPNIYTTVAELNPGTWKDIIGATGGFFSFIIGLIGIIMLALFKRDKEGNFDIKISLILILWFFASIYASLKGVRFIVLLIPAFAIAFGSAFGLLYNLTMKYSKSLGLDRRVLSLLLIGIFLSLMITPVKAGINTSKTYIPNINKTWYNTLLNIKEKTSKDAILNSWWDFGHWFKYVADRRVTLDGANQNSPPAYWLGRILVTDNEDEAVAILRMLDCGSNNAFNEIDKKKNNTRLSVELLRKILLLDRNNATKLLKKEGYDDEEITTILNDTKCQPPEDYFITSDDMIGKAGVWAHFGLWNFTRAEIMLKVKDGGRQEAIDFMMNDLNYSRTKAESTYNEIISLTKRERENWISKWPGFVSTYGSCRVNGTIIDCYNNLNKNTILTRLNLLNLDVSIPTSQGEIHPKSVVIYHNGDVKERKFEKAGLDLSFVVIIDNGKVNSLYCSEELARSMFTRLYFTNGVGLRHFRLFDNEMNRALGTRILVWNISWQPMNTTIRNNSIVKVDYIGYFENKTIFDSSIINWKEMNITPDSNLSSFWFDKPLEFKIGKSEVIPGFEKGIIGMKQGEEKTIVVTPDEGYKVGDLAGKLLYFKVKVISVR